MSKSQFATSAWFPLVAHKVACRTFDLSTGLNYVSIKDQVVRACALIDSLDAAGFLKSKAGRPRALDYDLVIIGAGAAGVTAAWRAVQSGARVLVVERSDRPFSVQRRCRQRHVSFSMYDWPEVFANTGAFPSLGGQPVCSTTPDTHAENGFPCVASTWAPRYAYQLVEEWDEQLRQNPIACNWMFNTRATPAYEGRPEILIDDPGYAHVELEDATGHRTEVFPSNVIIATGIGLERALPDSVFQSTPFWLDDPRAPWVSAIDPVGKSVVVSGSGDGAIQDVLKSVMVIESGDLIPIAEALFTKQELSVIKAKISAVERHAERQLLWGVSDHDVYRAMQASYDVIVSAIPGTRLKRWRTRYLTPVGPSVIWVMIEPKLFTKTYPLNRLLASVFFRSEFASRVTFRKGKMKSVSEQSTPPLWTCSLEDGTQITSHYPPMLRHGIDGNEVSEFPEGDLRTLRAAISRAPVPFKPFDF